MGGIADEPATARALAAYVLRGLDCGAVDAAEVRARLRAGRGAAAQTSRGCATRVGAWRRCLGANQYGKAENRVVRIVRDTPRHEIRDLNVSTSLRGAFADAHTTGDQALVLPTDTQKNTAFAYAKLHGDHVGRGLRARAGQPAARGVHGGDRGPGAGRGVRLGPDRRPLVRTPRRRGPHCVVTVGRDETHVLSGVQELVLLNSTDSEFKGFLKDEFTTLRRDRRPDPGHVAGGHVAAHRHRRRLERVVRRRDGHAPRHLRRHLLPRPPGDAARDGHAPSSTTQPGIAEIAFSAPNKHHFLVDFSGFDVEGLTNDGEVFIAADRPYGLIEAQVTRDDGPPAGEAWLHVPGFC